MAVSTWHGYSAIDVFRLGEQRNGKARAWKVQPSVNHKQTETATRRWVAVTGVRLGSWWTFLENKASFQERDGPPFWGGCGPIKEVLWFNKKSLNYQEVIANTSDFNMPYTQEKFNLLTFLLHSAPSHPFSRKTLCNDFKSLRHLFCYLWPWVAKICSGCFYGSGSHQVGTFAQHPSCFQPSEF